MYLLLTETHYLFLAQLIMALNYCEYSQEVINVYEKYKKLNRYLKIQF